MIDTTTPLTCVNCGRPETIVPLVSLRYRGQQAWICSQCLPTLIHKPQQLADKLPGAEQFGAADHDD